jgi:hypothetical protein
MTVKYVEGLNNPFIGSHLHDVIAKRLNEFELKGFGVVDLVNLLTLI